MGGHIVLYATLGLQHYTLSFNGCGKGSSEFASEVIVTTLRRLHAHTSTQQYVSILHLHGHVVKDDH